MRTVTSAILFLSALAIASVPFAEQAPTLPGVPGGQPAPRAIGPGTPAAPPGATPQPTVPTTAPSTIPTRPPTTAPKITPTAPPTTVPRTTPAPTTPPSTRPTTKAVTPAAGDDLIPFEFDNTQLSSIIKIVATSTRRNFLIQMPIAGSVTIHCPQMIPANTAFDILGIILDSQGYTMLVTETPPLIFVTKKAGSESLPTKLMVPEEGGPEEKHELATLIVVLKYVSVDDMQNILRNFKSTNCVMTAYPAGNFLILKDEQAKLKYLLSLIEKIDVAGTASKVTMVELKYADASETASQLTELLAAKEGARVTSSTAVRRPPTPTRTTGRPGTPSRLTTASPTIVGTATPLKILADARTNRLIILASEKDTEYIINLVKDLDKEPTEEQYPIRTYIAQYQNAEDLADTLASFVSGRPRTTTGRRTTRTTGARTRSVGQTGRTTAARTTGPTATGARSAVTGGTEEAFFLADPATNMILIQADPRNLDMYFNLLKELDRPQKQVLIEVWVVEISSKSQLDIGLEFKSAEIGPGERIGPMQDEIFGGSNFDLGLSDLLSGAGFPSSGVSLGMRSLTNTSLNVGGKSFYIPNIDTFLRALEEDTGFNILSSPKLMTLNYETASVDVSDEISIEESRIGYGTTDQEQAAAGYAATTTSTYQREQVGISLEITPQINSDDSVIMDIDLVVGSIAGIENIEDAGTRPVIANRSTITRVRVDNERTIVISGLRRADKTNTTSRVPILGHIPILGMLFSHSRTLTVNTNLLVFITPHIISDTLDMLAVTDLMKNQDLEKERARFQPTKKSRKRSILKKGREPGWEWKK